jgi:hypothetical protein
LAGGFPKTVCFEKSVGVLASDAVVVRTGFEVPFEFRQVAG